MSGGLQLVWFKRDLRVDDHRALGEAASRGPVLPLYIIEPDYWQLPDTSQRQQDFTAECLVELDRALRQRGQGLLVAQGQAVDVLAQLHQRHRFVAVHAHEETGNDWTYRRDLAVADWCRQQAVSFREYPQFGVVRRLGSRDGWARQWEAFMAEPLARPPGTLPQVMDTPAVHPRRLAEAPCTEQRPCPGRQSGGLRAGEQVLESFLSRRGRAYRGGISSPLSAETAGSRLSPHIAAGSLSLRRIVHDTRLAIHEWRDRGDTAWVRSLRQFDQRLHWHCHFIQKLEQRPAIEFHNVHRGFDGMREDDFNRGYFEAWCEGQTGYPLVDACMRFLHHQGWLNFRMRAMLMSFAAYHLWLHWREPSLHLARLFTDYEPGIHYNQCQMQSGTTGINTPRMYNPVKQAQDQDPDGHFVRRWCPELERVPTDKLFEPWRMGESERRKFSADQYPAPIVDYREAARQARSRLGEYRRQPGFRDQARAVHQALGSRKGSSSRRSKASDQRQGSLF
ncbi:MAG: FAD-binding domain-containing protein [Wenzhouxiangella sp.]